MNEARLRKELPLGLAVFAGSVALAVLFWLAPWRGQTSKEPPPAGQTLAGEKARSLHPRLPPAQLELPPERVRMMKSSGQK